MQLGDDLFLMPSEQPVDLEMPAMDDLFTAPAHHGHDLRTHAGNDLADHLNM